MEALLGVLKLVLSWPVVALIFFLRFQKPISTFISNIGELRVKLGDREVTVSAARTGLFLGAAMQKHGSVVQGTWYNTADVRMLVRTIGHAFEPSVTQQLRSSRILWVDDHPENNIYERDALETLGIRIDVSTSTEDALTKIGATKYDLVISDMGRPADARAGYTLLRSMKAHGLSLPFVIYSTSNAPEDKAQARSEGALESTNNPPELFDAVMHVLTRS